MIGATGNRGGLDPELVLCFRAVCYSLDMVCLRIAVLLAVPCLLSAAKTPITHEALWTMKRVGTPVPSPDGKWVVVPVVEPAYDEKDQSSDLWLVPSDGSAKARRITFTKGAESGAAWSPDSRCIAFSAKREGDDAPQIYVLDLSGGGEAARMTSMPAGASGPKWSPDGRMFAFTSTVKPEKKPGKYKARVYETFPIRYWDKWLEEGQTHIFVQAAEPGAKARDLLAGSQLITTPGFAATETASGEDPHAAWAPDGRSIAFSARVNRNEAAFSPVYTHLFVVSTDAGEPKQITRGKNSYSHPVFRPDGKALYASESREGEKIYSLERIAMFAWPNPGDSSIVTGQFDRSVSTYGFTPDSKTIYVTAEDAGLEKVYSLPSNGGDVKPVIEPAAGVITSLSISRNSPVLIATYESASSPMEVVRLESSQKTFKPLTNFNTAKAAELDLPALKHFWFTSKAGKRIHSMMALPPGFDANKKYPLFVVIHGGPHSMWRDQFVLRWNYHSLAAPGYVVLLTDYTGSTGYGEKFAQDIQGDPLKGPGLEINEAADEAIKQFAFIDGTRQAAGGASYGGHLANWLEATTTRYKCLLSHAGLVNLHSQWATSDTIYSREVTMGGPWWEGGKGWDEQNPIHYAKQFKTPMMLTVGEKDYRVPMNNTLENYSVLQRMRVPVKLIVFENANHWILNGEDSRFFYAQLHDWLKKWL